MLTVVYVGSLMYLFRGDLGCMLYTGDFRWELGCEEARSTKKALLEALAGDTVDNTYCHPSLNFPQRRVVAEQVSQIASIYCAIFCLVYATLSLQPNLTNVLCAVY